MTKAHNNNKKHKRTIEIEITLIDKKNSYITRNFGYQVGSLASHNHQRFYTSEANKRNGLMTINKKRGND